MPAPWHVVQSLYVSPAMSCGIAGGPAAGIWVAEAGEAGAGVVAEVVATAVAALWLILAAGWWHPVQVVTAYPVWLAG